MRARGTAFAIVFLFACGGDSNAITPPTDAPSHAQVVAMSTALTALLEYSYENPPIIFSRRRDAVAHGLAGAQAPYFGGIVCPEGGRTGVTGTISEPPLNEQTMTVTDTLLDCGIRDGKGAVWRFTSDGAVASYIDVRVVDPDHFETTQSDVGTIDYSSESVSGTCPFDITIADRFKLYSSNDPSTSLRIQTDGLICGRMIHADTLIDYTFPD